jgi:hypothetical protein
LSGIYWTERKTTGRITTSGRFKNLYEDYLQTNAGEYEQLI